VRPLSAVRQTASASYDAQEATGAVQASYRFDFAGFAIMPVVGLDYVHLLDGGAEESGAPGFDLDLAHRNGDSLRPFFAASASTVFTTLAGLRLVPEADLRYSHELFSTPPSLVSVGGGTFSVDNLTPSRDLVTVGAGLTARMSERLAFFADYHATLPTGNFWQQTVSAGFSYKF